MVAAKVPFLLPGFRAPISVCGNGSGREFPFPETPEHGSVS